jgi:proline iminopeptidase
MLAVGDEHRLYWEVSGNPNGVPVVFLHGGPGSGTSPWQRSLFNPQKYRIILFDQRGSGKSFPHASLQNNTTPHLVTDMELLRRELAIDKWVVFGGSWGSTLALAYADAHADKILGLVMYGIFLARESELRDLYYPGGIASRVFPDIFQNFIVLLTDDKKDDVIRGYRELFESSDPQVRRRALDLWTRLEKRMSRLVVTTKELQRQMTDSNAVLAHSLIENHYFLDHGFIDGDALLRGIGAKVRDIPVHIVQGRYDMVCPFKTAYELHLAIPHSALHIIEDVGHTAQEPRVQKVLVDVLDRLPV